MPYDEEGALLIVTESLYLDIETFDLWNHVTTQEADRKNRTFEDEPFSYQITWPAEVLDPLRPGEELYRSRICSQNCLRSVFKDSTLPMTLPHPQKP